MIYVWTTDASFRSYAFLERRSRPNFRSGAAVLNARSTGVDCFVLDYKMPDMNGSIWRAACGGADIATR